MTLRQLAEDYTRIAEKLTVLESGDSSLPFPRGLMDAECAAGGAALLCYLRDLFTATPTETFNRADILVILETLSRDNEIFPCGIGTTMWDCEVNS